MRKQVSLLAAAVLTAVLLAGCGSSGAGQSTAGQTAAGTTESSVETEVQEESSAVESQSESQEAVSSDATEETAQATEETEDTNDGAGNVLVMYYSGSGNTARIADIIAADTGADEYVVKPAEPYTDDDLNWRDENSRVVREYENESLQDVAFDSTDIPNLDSYETVFVGYPIWWQDASWVMKSFVKYVDFTGKTVIPFATSSSSGIGESGNHLEEIAGTGDWLEGQRFSGSASEDEVQEWVDSLGL